MASDCRLVAMASQRDSSSMKVMAFVTMSFLPGTFVASIFSMPLFDWSASDRAAIFRRDFWLPRLRMYLAITIPLMAFTFAIWGFWLFFQSVAARKRAAAVRTQLGLDANRDEAKMLAVRRSTLRMDNK